MRNKCKNCTYFYVSKKDNAWCTRQLQYTNVDGCCNEYRRKRGISMSSIVALVISAIALVLSLARLIQTL